MKHLDQITQIKSFDDEKMTFTAYGNTFNYKDFANDVSMKGCFAKSISNHAIKNTMPKFYYNHNSSEMPLGCWLSMKEDNHGLLLEGKFADTPRGREAYELVKMGALDSFSIGYRVISEKWNSKGGYNELHEVELHEVSLVNRACNDQSLLQSVKSEPTIDDFLKLFK